MAAKLLAQQGGLLSNPPVNADIQRKPGEKGNIRIPIFPDQPGDSARVDLPELRDRPEPRRSRIRRGRRQDDEGART